MTSSSEKLKKLSELSRHFEKEQTRCFRQLQSLSQALRRAEDRSITTQRLEYLREGAELLAGEFAELYESLSLDDGESAVVLGYEVTHAPLVSRIRRIVATRKA